MRSLTWPDGTAIVAHRYSGGAWHFTLADGRRMRVEA